MTMYMNIILDPWRPFILFIYFFFWGGKGKIGQNQYCESAFYGFSNIGTTILEEQLSWDIFRLKAVSGHFQSMADFWAGQNVGRAGHQRWPQVEKRFSKL